MNLIQTKSHLGWGSISWKLLPSNWPGGKSARHFLVWWLMREGSKHCRWCHTWAVVLGCIRSRLGRPFRERQKAALSQGLCICSHLGFLHRQTGTCQSKSLSPQVAFVFGIYHRNLTRTEAGTRNMGCCGDGSDQVNFTPRTVFWVGLWKLLELWVRKTTEFSAVNKLMG